MVQPNQGNVSNIMIHNNFNVMQVDKFTHSDMKADLSLRGDCQDVVDMLMPDGSSYTGQISTVTHMKHGQGSQTWQDGARYVGEWRNGQAQGQGVFNHANGDVFEGTFAQDKANGFGAYKHKSGQRYEGEWLDDLQHGNGKEVLEDGSTYTG